MVNFAVGMQRAKSREQEICGTDDSVSETDEFQVGKKRETEGEFVD